MMLPKSERDKETDHLFKTLGTSSIFLEYINIYILNFAPVSGRKYGNNHLLFVKMYILVAYVKQTTYDLQFTT